MVRMQIVGHGVDLVEISRIARMLDDHSDHFINRCFTPGERAYAESSPQLRAERYAARFACKEAVMKAVGTGWAQGVSWTEIDVQLQPGGKPTLVLSGRCAEIAAGMGIRTWHISLSHTAGMAMASVIAGA